jgi:hypothetical protein
MPVIFLGSEVQDGDETVVQIYEVLKTSWVSLHENFIHHSMFKLLGFPPSLRATPCTQLCILSRSHAGAVTVIHQSIGVQLFRFGNVAGISQLGLHSPFPNLKSWTPATFPRIPSIPANSCFRTYHTRVWE